MKKKYLILSVFLGIFLCFATGCDALSGIFGGNNKAQFIDYAAQVTLDMNSETLKQEVTVKNYIDGDTTHFNAPTSIAERGLLKARYLACNTPESTGKIEEWGKKASNFTKERLKSADSIIIETDGTSWDKDSTGERYLVWVWYKSADTNGVYRNLNIELLQNGLAWGSKAGDTRYGSICTKAISNASDCKMHIFSNESDPDFFYGEAYELTLKELRLNVEDYVGARVAFEGTVTQYSSNGVYVEDFDEETQQYYGMYLYYGFTLSHFGQELLVPGNRMRIVGKVSPYTTDLGTTYQVSDLNYDPFDLENPNNIQLIAVGTDPVSYTETSAETFTSNKTINVETEDGSENQEFAYGELAMHTAVAMNGLYVKDAYTTDNGGNSDGAITLTCELDGKTITVRTASKLKDDNGEVLVEDDLVGKTIDVKGIVDSFNGIYQIKVFIYSNLVIHN